MTKSSDKPKCRTCGSPMALMDEGQQRWYCYKDDQLYYADINKGYTYTWDTNQYGTAGPLQQTGKDPSKGTGVVTAFVLIFAAVFCLMFFLLAGTHAFCIDYGFVYVCFHLYVAFGVAFVVAFAALLIFNKLRQGSGGTS